MDYIIWVEHYDGIDQPKKNMWDSPLSLSLERVTSAKDRRVILDWSDWRTAIAAIGSIRVQDTLRVRVRE